MSHQCRSNLLTVFILFLSLSACQWVGKQIFKCFGGGEKGEEEGDKMTGDDGRVQKQKDKRHKEESRIYHDVETYDYEQYQ